MAQAAANISEQLKYQGMKTAIYFSDCTSITYEQLGSITQKATSCLRKNGITPGEAILIAAPLSSELYAFVIAASLMGVHVILVEPWLPLADIEHAIDLVKPKIFVTSTLGRLWGLRVQAVRRIPNWVNISSIHSYNPESLEALELPEGEPCLITFTSGTTGAPKGVVRTHGYLAAQADVITRSLGTAEFSGADLVFFANLTLLNLGLGRTSVLMRRPWAGRDWKWLSNFHETPLTSTVCGPAVLGKILNLVPLPEVKALFVGGALADCSLLERACHTYPSAKLVYVYGSTEVEPVSFTSFRETIDASRSEGSFQATFLGKLTSEISVRGQGLLSPFWVAGKHVAGEYLGVNPANATHKQRGHDGVLWHRMGDQIDLDDHKGVWYRGREGDRHFYEEQRIYQILGHSCAILTELPGYGLSVVGEQVAARSRVIKAAMPEIASVLEAPVKRDRRHRARIDRASMIRRYT